MQKKFAAQTTFATQEKCATQDDLPEIVLRSELRLCEEHAGSAQQWIRTAATDDRGGGQPTGTAERVRSIVNWPSTRVPT